MSARERATRRNQIKINAVVADFKARKERQAAARKSQVSFSSSGLGAKTIAAQQRLSEQFGIPTFDVEGNISTLPQTRAIDNSINVGTGRFSRQTFNQSIENLLGITQDNFAPIAPLVGFTQTSSDILFTSYFTCKPPKNLTQSDVDNKNDIRRQLESAKEQLRIVRSRPARSRTDKSARVSLPSKISRLRQKVQFFDCQSNSQVRAKAKLDEDVIILEKLIMKDPLTDEIKVRIKDAAEQVNVTLTNIAKFGVKITTQALLEVGEVMNAAKNRLRQKVETEIDNSINISDGIIDFFKPATDIIGGGLSIVVESLMELFTLTPEKVLEKYQIEIEGAQLIRAAQLFPIDLEAKEIEEIQKELAKE